MPKHTCSLFQLIPILWLFMDTNFWTAEAYHDGAPFGMCLDVHMVHDYHSSQTSECPFKLTLSSQTYTPGAEIEMRLSAINGAIFRGFVIVGFRNRPDGDGEEAVGDFIRFPEEKAKLSFCANKPQRLITHRNNNTVSSVDIVWKAPSENEGDILFRYAVVVDFETYWDRQEVVLKSDSRPTNLTYPNLISASFDPINWEECGVTKGCFLYPSFCTGSDCYLAATYHEVGDNFVFELASKHSDYVAIGLSDDKLMGLDFIHTCTGSYGYLTVQNGYNPELFSIRTYKTVAMTELSVRSADGELACRFTRPRTLETFTLVHDMAVSDLYDEFYIFLAVGDTYKDSPILYKHRELPVISEVKVKFRETAITRGSSLSLNIRVHGILMLIAWILMVGVSSMVSRYYRIGFGRKIVLGSQLWFQLHRGFAITAWVLTAASFILIFVTVGKISLLAPTHSYMGIALMAAVTCQVLAGMLRPGLSSPYRPIFNWGHWFLGRSSHILAAVCCIFAFIAPIMNVKQRDFGVIVISVWIGMQIVLELVFEVRKCKNKDCQTYEVETKSSEFQPEQKPKNAALWDIPFLCLYIFCMCAILAAAILSVALF